MAPKKRRKQAPAQKPVRPQAARPADPAVTPAPAAATGGQDAMLRAVERSLSGAPRGQAALYADASIPLDRVPYFLHDLRLIAMVVGTLVVLLLLGGTLLLDQVIRLF